jgi:NADH:ubiquinone oxidoreductase subunit H
MISSIRTAIGMLNLEIFMGLMMLSLITVGESFSFNSFVMYQENY